MKYLVQFYKWRPISPSYCRTTYTKVPTYFLLQQYTNSLITNPAGDLLSHLLVSFGKHGGKLLVKEIHWIQQGHCLEVHSPVLQITSLDCLLKFIYSEMASQIWWNPQLIWRFKVEFKSTGRFRQSFVAFSKYMNFIKIVSCREFKFNVLSFG